MVSLVLRMYNYDVKKLYKIGYFLSRSCKKPPRFKKSWTRPRPTQGLLCMLDNKINKLSSQLSWEYYKWRPGKEQRKVLNKLGKDEEWMVGRHVVTSSGKQAWMVGRHIVTSSGKQSLVDISLDALYTTLTHFLDKILSHRI